MKRRKLAASVVVTVGTLLTGCAHEKPVPEGPIRNPPVPIVIAPTPTTTVAEPDPDPDPVGLPKAPVGEPGHFVRKDGACFWQPPAQNGPIDCPPDISCNPPAPPEPYAVECPAEDPSLPKAPAGVYVQTRPNGSCFYYQPRDVHCSPGRTCNPPPPRAVDVRCPKS
jgi:hypothetical protein